MSRAREAAALRERAMDALELDPGGALQLAERAAAIAPDAESFYVLGLAWGTLGELDRAIEALRRALQLDEEHDDARAALAQELLDALFFEEAAEHAAEVLRAVPLHATALWVRGCLRERREDFDGADRDFQAAALADPVRYPLPQRLTDEDVATIVEEVVSSLHPSLQRYLEDVPVILDETPPEEVLHDLEPPGRPTELLGCFSGASLADRSTGGTWATLPSSISLYRRNIERIAQDRDEVLAELRTTLLHEIGHFLGLDEEDLAERGLE